MANQEPNEGPDCGASFVGNPIPEERRQNYGDRTHFRNCIGIVHRDRTVGYMCHKCSAVRSRDWATKYNSVKELLAAN
jgi:hypothetical protein